jgi:hypothetical protein
MVASLMDQKGQSWLDELGVEPADAFHTIDCADYRAKVMQLREAVQAEFEKIDAEKAAAGSAAGSADSSVAGSATSSTP